MNQNQSQNTLEGIAVVAVLISSFLVWIGSGYLIWHWLEVHSFFDGVIFVILWGIIGGLAQTFISPLISVSIIYFCSLFVADQSHQRDNSLYNATQLPQPIQHSSQNKKFGTHWTIFIVICISIALYQIGKKSYPNQSANPAYSTQTPSSKGLQPSAECYDGTLSYSLNHQGTCSHHGGVKTWLDSQPNPLPAINAPVIDTQTVTVTAEPLTLPQLSETTQSNNTIDDSTLVQLKSEFDNGINYLNQAWKQLDPNIRKIMLEEQRAFNKARETDCQQYASTVQGNDIQKQMANLSCQIERLKQRTQYLQNQASVVIPPTQQPSVSRPIVEEQTINYMPSANSVELQEAKTAYNDAIKELNKVWQQLPNSTRESIRLEQRTNNQMRELSCKEQALSNSENSEKQEIIRLSCEVPLIEERTEYLKTLLPLQIMG